jgi:hypothetical protein
MGWCRLTCSMHSYWLCGVTFCKSKSNKWSKVLITSGINDTWVIPTAARMLFSQVRAKNQGHRCILDGLNPGLIIGDTGDFIPFVIEEETQFCMFPMYPPPTSSARHAGLYSSSMRVLNLKESGKSSSKAHALVFNPLVSKILLKRSALKRASHADRKQGNCCKLNHGGFRRKNSDCWKRSVVSSRKRD